MQSVANRRTFVRHMVVGVPVLAATTSLPKTVDGAAVHEGHTASATLDSIVRDLGRLHNEMQRRGLKPDDLRAFITHVRALGLYQSESNRDTELVRNIRAVIARGGRQSIIDHTPDPEMMRQELVSLGFDVKTAPVGLIDAGRRAEALDRLARGGLAPAYFETVFAGDDPAMFLVTALASSTTCDTLKDMLTTIESVAAVMCSLAVIIPLAVPDCFAASSTLATLKLLILLLRC